MGQRPHDIGIVGCGTAGPACALFLARAGHRVTLYERVARPGPVGAGIVLQPTGRAVLRRLGLEGAVLERGARIERLYCTTARGRVVLDLDYASEGPSAFGLGLHRGVLFEVLFGALERAPLALRLGADVAKLRRVAGGRVALLDDAGARLGVHDLVVVADGARSRLRDAVAAFVPTTARRYPWGALWFVAEDFTGAFHGALRQVVDGTRRLIGLLPTGRGPSGAGDTPLVSLFYSLRGDALDAFRARGLAAFRDEVVQYVPAAEPVVAQIARIEDLLFAGYHDVAMARWHAPGVVILGDAAHAMSPQLGQGCNLALCDAEALADCLAEAPDLDAALAAYSARRRDHLRFYELSTRYLTPLFQSDAEPLGWARDLVMGPLGGVPFLRAQMIASMCGAKCGVFARSRARS